MSGRPWFAKRGGELFLLLMLVALFCFVEQMWAASPNSFLGVRSSPASFFMAAEPQQRSQPLPMQQPANVTYSTSYGGFSAGSCGSYGCQPSQSYTGGKTSVQRGWRYGGFLSRLRSWRPLRR